MASVDERVALLEGQVVLGEDVDVWGFRRCSFLDDEGDPAAGR